MDFQREPEASSSLKSRPRFTYHVFLSFRGEDTRKTFTDHLYTALVREGIRTFRDDNELERGEDIKSDLQRAIKESRVSILVLSENYANSGWCLDELVEILERKKTFGHKVFPLFYEVDPTQVGMQTGSFAEAFLKHEERFKGEKDETRNKSMEKVRGWRKALKEVAESADMVYNDQTDGRESNFIQEIVEKVRSSLNRMVLNVARYPIGLESRVQSINRWIQDSSDDVVIGVILGIGGIGKTTIAKTVYNSNFEKFEGSSFLANIRMISEQPKGLIRLQRQLLSDIVKLRKQKIYNIDEGITKIKDAICCKRVLIVLDDVGEVEQIDAIFEMRNWFFPGSKIIITSRNERLLKAHETYKIYDVEELDNEESLKLLSWHAFGQDHPTESYMELSKSVIRHCGGLPLALEVLGSSLYGRTLEVWQNALEKLKAFPDNKIQKVLEISFNSLEDDHDKNLFLHIACFFVGKDYDYVVKVLDACGFYTVVGIEDLGDRSLMVHEVSDKVMMHDLLRDMGREIVRRESPQLPGRRSRLWHHRDSFNTLRRKTGTEKIQGLVLDMHMLKEDKSFTKVLNPSTGKQGNPLKQRSGFSTSLTNLFPVLAGVSLTADAFSTMHNLRLLQLNYVQLNGDFTGFPKMLKWLCWHGFPLKFIPGDFPIENLVVLDMRNSSLEQLWRGTKVLGFLKILNLSHSHDLIKTPNFSGLPALERLILKYCRSLVAVDKSIGGLKKLVILNLKGCKNLRKLPPEICEVKSLEKIILSECSKFEGLPTELKELDSLKILHADKTHMIQSYSITRKLGSWNRILKPRENPKHSWFSLPRSLVKLSLWNCDLSDQMIPNDLTGLPMLVKMDLGENPITRLPDGIKDLTMLQILRLDFCPNLQEIPELPSNLMGLNASNCPSLERITNLPGWGNSLNLELLGCGKLVEIPGMFSLEPIDQVDEEVIGNLQLFDLESVGDVEVELYNHFAQQETKGPIQVLSEFGIYNTFVPGREVPERFIHKSSGSSISFTVPSPLNHNIRGLNICIVYQLLVRNRGWVTGNNNLEITNKTKGVKLIYDPIFLGIPGEKKEEDGDYDLLWISHWKILNHRQLEAGDEMNVSAAMENFKVKQCGVEILYCDQETEDFQEDVTIYGDLSEYQMNTGAYLLCNHDCIYQQVRSGTNWTHQKWMEITWLTDDEGDYDEEDDDDDDESL